MRAWFSFTFLFGFLLHFIPPVDKLDMSTKFECMKMCQKFEHHFTRERRRGSKEVGEHRSKFSFVRWNVRFMVLLLFWQDIVRLIITENFNGDGLRDKNERKARIKKSFHSLSSSSSTFSLLLCWHEASSNINRETQSLTSHQLLASNYRVENNQSVMRVSDSQLTKKSLFIITGSRDVI